MLKRIILFCLLIGDLVVLPMANAQDQLPDLIPVVIDANQGSIEVRNIGNATAEPSELYVVCSSIKIAKIQPCGRGLHLPGYIEKWNVLPYDIPALEPGSRFSLQLFGSGGFPRLEADSYGMKITIDPLRKITESNEGNNYTRLDTVLPEKGSGILQVKVLMNGKLIKSAIVVTQPGNPDKVVLQTESIPGKSGRQMKQTPFDVTLPAGKYDLYVRTEMESPLKTYLRTKALPIVIKNDERLESSIVIPTGHLQLSTSVEGKEKSGIKLDMMGLNRNFNYFSSTGYLETPIDIIVPAGTYKVNTRNTEEKQVQTINVDIKAGSSISKLINFDKLQAGYLILNLVMDGKPIPFKFGWASAAEAYLTDVNLFSSETGKPAAPLESGYNNQPVKLRVGNYDLKVHERAVGGKDYVIERIAIREGETIEKTVEIRQPGTLNIMGRWVDQPRNLLACAKYYNPLNINRLGSLMGGGSGAGGRSRGDCFSPDVFSLAAAISGAGQTAEDMTEIERLQSIAVAKDNGQFKAGDRIGSIKMEAGVYDIVIWPVDHQELKQTLKAVEIFAGGVVQQKLEFRWPDKEK